jgi:hypothetical protein
MLLPVFLGQKYSYSYEVETGHYLLHDNEYKSHIYLQGDDAVPPNGGTVNKFPIGKRPVGTYDARIFREEIKRIDDLPEREYKTGLLTENAVKFYL